MFILLTPLYSDAENKTADQVLINFDLVLKVTKCTDPNGSLTGITLIDSRFKLIGSYKESFEDVVKKLMFDWRAVCEVPRFNGIIGTDMSPFRTEVQKMIDEGPTTFGGH